MNGAVLLDRHRPSRRVDSSELEELKRTLTLDWRDRTERIRESGEPMADRQYFEALQEPVPVGSFSQITGTAEAAMWAMTGAAPAPPTLIPANGVRPGQILAVRAWGVTTTPGASATTLTLTPRWGTTTGGVSLGASNVSNTAIISRSNDPWYLDFVLTIRAIGSTGSATGGGRFHCPAIGTAAANPGTLVFGGGIATIDTTVASGIWIGATLGGSASWLLTTQGVAFEYLN